MAQKQLHIIHITEDFSDKNFGVTKAMEEIIDATSHLFRHSIVTVNNMTDTKTMTDVEVHAAEQKLYGEVWKYSPDILTILKKINGSNKKVVYHIHGIWMAPQLIAATYGVSKGIPVVLSPHNMLCNWLWKRNTMHNLKNSIYWGLNVSIGRDHVVKRP